MKDEILRIINDEIVPSKFTDFWRYAPEYAAERIEELFSSNKERAYRASFKALIKKVIEREKKYGRHYGTDFEEISETLRWVAKYRSNQFGDYVSFHLGLAVGEINLWTETSIIELREEKRPGEVFAMLMEIIDGIEL